MRMILAALLLIPGLALADVNGTFTGTGGTAETSVNKQALLILNGTFGTSGVVTVLVKAKDATACSSQWCTTGQTYTTNGAYVIDVGDATTITRVSLTSSGGSSLYYEIRD